MANGNGVSVLPPQLVRPRPVQFETPNSYLGRICAANVIDVEYLERLAARRRSATRRADELGYLIEELGGPARAHFQNEFRRAGGWPGTWPRQVHAFSPNLPARRACDYCTGGAPAKTFYHREFMICGKHRRWLGDRSFELQQTAGRAAVAADRRLRRIAAAGLVSVTAYDRIADLLRGYLTGTMKVQPASPPEASPSLVQFPSQVQLLALVTNYMRLRCPDGKELPEWHRRPEQANLRQYLRPRINAMRLKPQPEVDINWLLEGLVEVVIIMLGDRTDHVAGF